MRSIAFVTALTLAVAAHAQEVVPQRHYKLQQPGMVEQMRQLKPVASTRLSQTQVNMIAEQLMRCWKPSRVIVEKNLAVDLQITYSPDGTPSAMSLAAEKVRLLEDADFRDAVKVAMDAVRQCSPLQGIQQIPYEQWQYFELVFAPTVVDPSQPQ